MNIKELEEKIVQTSTAYYEGEAIISDEEFDGLLQQLKSIDPGHHLLHRTGHGYVPSVKSSRKHLFHVGSLPKTHEIDALKMGDVLSMKLDGLSLVAYYRAGKLLYVLTRGDGEEGIEVTNKVRVPQNVHPDIRAVRMEGLISKSNFERRLKADYRNPRNAVSGIVGSLTSNHYDLIDCVAYKAWLGDQLHPIGFVREEDVETSLFLQEQGFTVVSYWVYNGQSLDELDAWRKSSGYQTDGIVINDCQALKFETELVETRVVKVEWDSTPSGRIQPVVVVEPVELYGTTVTRCSGMHAQYVKTSGIGAGALVEITKANEIIPYITRVVVRAEQDRIELPEHCSKCLSPVSWNSVHLCCPRRCTRSVDQVKSFITIHADVDGIGEKVIERFMYALQFTNLPGLVERLQSRICDFGQLTEHEKSLWQKMVEKLKLPLDQTKLLQSLNLDGCGQTNSEALAPHIPAIIKVSDVKSHIVQNRDQVFRDLLLHRDLIELVFNSFAWYTPAKRLGKRVVLTGKFTVPKSQLVSQLESKGFVNSEKIEVGTLLITADKTSASSKMQQAVKLGCEIMDEQEARQKLL